MSPNVFFDTRIITSLTQEGYNINLDFHMIPSCVTSTSFFWPLSRLFCCMCCGRQSHHLLPLVVWLRVSQPQRNWHFMLDNSLLWGPVLCVVGYLSLCIISLHPLDTGSISHSKVWQAKMYLDIAKYFLRREIVPGWEFLEWHISFIGLTFIGIQILMKQKQYFRQFLFF